MNLNISLCIKLFTASIVLSQSLNLLSIPKADAAGFKFTKIVDGTTPIPGGTGNFYYLFNPNINGNNIVFAGGSEHNVDLLGVYATTGTNKAITKIADQNTPIPGGIGKFEYLGQLSVSGSNIAIAGGTYGHDAQSGIYITKGINGALTKFADTNTPIPSGTGSFKWVGYPSISGNNIAFVGGDASHKAGIYANTGENRTFIKIADTNTPVPSGIGSFKWVGYPSISGNNITFLGDDATSKRGIYANTSENGALIKIIDISTPIPTGTDNSHPIDYPSTGGSNITFVGSDASGKTGIYANLGENGALIKIVDTNTPVPDGVGNFDYFSEVKRHGNTVTFVGRFYDGNYYQSGLYIYLDGILSKVISSTDTLFPDKKIVEIYDISRHGFDGESLAFGTFLSDASMAIFRADRISEPVPEPLTLGGTAVAGVVGLWFKKKKKKVAA
jgi:hypothetical protein